MASLPSAAAASPTLRGVRSSPLEAMQDAFVHAAAWPLARSRLLILTYHRILPQPDPMLPDDVDVTTFAWQMQLLKAQFNPLPLAEAVRRLKEGALPARAACVTLDDGYANNFTVALPVLERWSIPATIFIATGFLDGGRMWNDTVIEAVRATPLPEIDLEPIGLGRRPAHTPEERVTTAHRLIDAIKYREPAERERCVEEIVARSQARLPGDLMMSSTQVAALARAGVEVGGHTVSHPILARLPAREAEREIQAGRDRLQEITGRAVRIFAYPNGRPGQDYAAEHVAMARGAGFEAAVSTAWGCARPGTDLWQLPRVAPWDRSRLRFSLRLLSAYRGQSESVTSGASGSTAD